MRNSIICITVLLPLAAIGTQVQAEDVPEQAASGAGTVSGTVKVWKTKVKTTGNKSFKDVVVYLEKEGGAEYPPPAGRQEMDQKGLVFIPHVMAVQKGTTVDFLNSDNDKHNVYFLFDETQEKKDIGTWNPGESRDYQFNESGPVITLCKLHLEMAAYIVVLDTPYFTIAEINGATQEASYSIKNVPPGKYLLNTWHKKLKLRGGGREVTVESGKSTTADLEITKGKYAGN